MKKLVFLLLALPFWGMLASCDNDAELPNVNIDIVFENGIVSGSDVYVVKPNMLYVSGISVEAVNPNHNAMVAGLVTYRVDGIWPGFVASPYDKFSILTEDLSVGPHVLTAEMGIAEEECELARALVAVKFIVVEDESEIPGDPSSWRDRLPVDIQLQ